VCPVLIDPESIQRVEKLCHKDNLVGKKLYVGNLTDSVSSSDLQKLFTPFGTVQSAQVIQDRDLGRSKGFGFVEMDTDAQAEAAIQGLNDHEHEGRRLVVSEAKPREARTVGFAGGRARQY
jgi:cold-inducible RNA-binding protein